MRKQEKYVGSYNWEHRNYFGFSTFEKEVISKLENIINFKSGIYVLCGNQGTGKTSLKNRAVEISEAKNKNIIINITRFTSDKSMLREILKQLNEKLDTFYNKEGSKFLNEIADFRLENHHIIHRLDKKSEKKQDLFEDNEYDFFFTKYRLIAQANRFISEVENHFGTSQINVENQTLRFRAVIKDLKNKLDRYRINHVETVNFHEKIIKLVDKSNHNIDKKYLMDKFENLTSKLKILQKGFELIENLEKFLGLSILEKDRFDLNVTSGWGSSTDFKNIKKMSLEAGISLEKIPLINSKTNVAHQTEIKSNDIQFEKFEKSLTEEEKYSNIIKLLQVISPIFKVTLIIDELDKSPYEEVVKLINDYKSLFFDSKLTTILVLDIYATIYLQKYQPSYIQESNLLLVKSLNLYDYMIRTTNLGNPLAVRFFDILSDFYYSRGNNRKLVNNFQNRRCSILGFNLFLFQNSDFYDDFSDINKEILLNFIIELFEYLILIDELNIEAYDEFVEEFLEHHKINDLLIKGLFTKLKNVLKRKEFALNFYTSNATNFSDVFENNMLEFLTNIQKKYSFFHYKDDNNILLKLSNSNNISFDFTKFLSKKNISEYEFIEWFKRKALLKPDRYLDRNYKLRISTTKEYDSDNGISDAENIISRYINEIIGVILFYPYNHKDSAEWYEKPLKNGFVIRKNDFEELICYPYVGYIGLHSHKPQKLEEFKKFLNDRKVKYYEVPENQDGIDIWRECFEEKNDVVQAEKIMEVCNSYRIKEWIKELRTY